MALREFRDEHGVEWRAWDVRPRPIDGPARPTAGVDATSTTRAPTRNDSGEARLRMRPGWEGGWLSFESAAEKRRLVPLPARWDDATDDQLRQWLASATPFPKRGSFIE
jgi:hypothetical protein